MRFSTIDSLDDLAAADLAAAMNGPGSPTPYIKEEADDGPFTPRFLAHPGLDPHHAFAHAFADAVDPQALLAPNFATSTTYMHGGAGIADDELEDSLAAMDPHAPPPLHHHHAFADGVPPDGAFFAPAPPATSSANPAVYSHTPDELPIQSPFVQSHQFDFSQYQSTPRVPGFHPAPSAAMGRPRLPLPLSTPDARSPMSPKGSAMAGLHLGTPDSGSFPSQAMGIATHHHRHHTSLSSPWDNTPGSARSWLDSPTQSPHTGSSLHPPQPLSEVLHPSPSHAPSSSLPAKVDVAGQSQDAKKRRRRESHNQVERRRRDNINERIQDLSRLVPQHRLEDDRVRKYINNNNNNGNNGNNGSANGPLSPTLAATSASAAGMSPPPGPSLLAAAAGASARRAPGNITQGLPLDDKDKGPNKGDILNGAVGWTRDLMWLLYKKLRDADDLAARLRQLTGEVWPADHESEDERRMRSELVDAVEKNGPANFDYSRGPGSGLRVPKHTNVAGDALHHLSPQSLSPGLHSAGSANHAPAFWAGPPPADDAPFALKEEDEYHGMDLG